MDERIELIKYKLMIWKCNDICQVDDPFTSYDILILLILISGRDKALVSLSLISTMNVHLIAQFKTFTSLTCLDTES